MFCLLFPCLVFLIYHASASITTNLIPVGIPLRVNYIELWNEWKISYEKMYRHVDESSSMDAWIANWNQVYAHNARVFEGKEFYMQELNKFADREPERLMTVLRSEVPATVFSEKFQEVALVSQGFVPDYVNWGVEGWISSYKAGGFYPNGWTFSATKAIEAQLYNLTRRYNKLSRKEITDCFNDRLRRPLISIDAFSYIKKNGVTSDHNYPMIVAKRESCKQSKRRELWTIWDYHLLQPDDEENLKRAVFLIGPISVSIRVTDNFFFYLSGIFFDPECGKRKMGLNHSVLLVGYGTDPVGGDFWIILNNWGTRWGENGFARMARNTLVNCGIASAAIYPALHPQQNIEIVQMVKLESQASGSQT